MLILLALAFLGDFRSPGTTPRFSKRFVYYWHFVDGISVFVLTSVYILPLFHEMTTAQFLLSAWTWNPVVLVARGSAVDGLPRGLSRWQQPLRWFPRLAIAVLWWRLISPINALADGYLFSAHMVAAHSLSADRAGTFLLLLCRGRWPNDGVVSFSHPLFGWLPGSARCGSGTPRRFATRPFPHGRSTRCKASHFLSLGTLLLVAGHGAARAGRLTRSRGVGYLFTACTACSAARDYSHFFAGHDLRDLLHATGRPARDARDDPQTTGA